MKKLIVCLCIIYGLIGSYAHYTEEDESGSGNDDNAILTKKKANATNDEINKSLRSGESVFDVGSENIMAHSGARQVMQTIATKLASHTSNKITNHFGKMLQTSISKDADLLKKTNKLSSFVKASPIGPMETISVVVQGNASTTSNFTKLKGDETEVVRPEKAGVLNFQQAATESNVDDSIRKHKLTGIGKVQKKKMHKKKHTKKRKFSKSKKSQFPKIILYQGPISKALENILTARSSSNQVQNRVVTPMTFEEATADIKRSNIAHAKTNMLTTNQSFEKNIEEDRQNKKSKLHKKAPKKYTIKGYADSWKADKKSFGTKKSASNKNTFSMVYDLNGGKSNNDEKLKAGFGTIPIFTLNPFDAIGNNMEASNPPSNKDQNLTPANAFPPFLPQHPIVSSPFPDNFGVSILNSNSKQDKQKSLKAENAAVQKHLNENDKDFPNNQNSFNAPSSEIVDQEQDDPDDNDDFVSDKNSTVLSVAATPTLPKGTNIDMEPVQNEPFKNNPEIPQPVVNAPDHDRPVNAPDFDRPVNEDNNKDDTEEESEEDEEEEDPHLPSSVTMLPIQPANEINKELLERVQANSRGLETLSGEVSDVKNRVGELAVSLNDMENELKKIEKKLIEKKAKESFVNFAGPLTPLQQHNPFFGSPRVIEIIKKPTFKLVKEPFFFNRPLPINIMEGPEILNNQPSFTMFSSIKQRKPFNFPLERRKPKVLKEIFLPLPPPDSAAAKDIEDGKPMPGLPWPINQIVSMMMRQLEKSTQRPVKIPKVQLHVTKPLRQPLPLPDIDYPPREHDIDQLELELGRIPITRLGVKENQRPKIVFFPKEQNIGKPFELTGKDCDEPCLNGGFCTGGNTCKCPVHFVGPKCERGIHRSFTELVEIIPSEEVITPKKSNLFSFPLGSSTNEDEDSFTKETVGQVDQREVIDALSKFIDQIPVLSEKKRSSIPQKPILEDEVQFLKKKK